MTEHQSNEIVHCKDDREICNKVKSRFEGKCLKKYYLHQEDFDNGTYRIKKSGIYILKEDIVFNPNPENDFRPNPLNEEYQGKAYKLGFFAAITVECHNVIIDLNCKTLRMSHSFALQQRFASLIEFASSPFIPKQGPGDFGEIKCADTCWVKNGNLGLSSHHGIHGNGCDNILIEDLKIFNFEVAGIAINGGNYICIRNCDIGACRQDVPVLGNYSALRFLIPFYQETIAKLQALPVPPVGDIDTLQAQLLILQNTSDQVLQEVLDCGEITSANIFYLKNTSGLPDGSAVYGILFHPQGVAVNDHIEETYGGKLSKYIAITNVSIHGLAVKPIEIIGLSSNITGTGVFNDPSGSVLPIALITDNAGFYSGNPLTDAQLILGSVALANGLTVGRMNFNEDLINFLNGATIDSLLGLGYKYKCGGDWMFHVMKGLFGARFDALRHLYLKNINIRYLRNDGFLGNNSYCGNYIVSHDAQVRGGYHGADISGISLSYVLQSSTHCVTMFDLRSKNGSVCGIKFMNQCDCVVLDQICIKNLISKYKFEDGVWYFQSYDGVDTNLVISYPNLPPNAFGIVIEDDNCKNISVGEYLVKCLIAPSVVAKLIYRNDMSPNGQTEEPATESDSCPCF